MKKMLWLFSIVMMAVSSSAEAITHKVIKEKSTLTFFATVNDVSSEGAFTDFDVDINFNIHAPQDSTVTGEVRLNKNTITAKYEEVAKGLLGEEWLNVAKYPKATFEIESFEATTPNNYKGYGTLTLLGVRQNFECNMILTPEKDGALVANAFVLVDRLKYGIGKGEWVDTKTVNNIVTVYARLVTTPVGNQPMPTQTLLPQQAIPALPQQ
jgi:polyisoprenoid-binding protein YceI